MIRFLNTLWSNIETLIVLVCGGILFFLALWVLSNLAAEENKVKRKRVYEKCLHGELQSNNPECNQMLLAEIYKILRHEHTTTTGN